MDTEKQLLALAIERGILTQAQLTQAEESLIADRTRVGGSYKECLQILLAQGALQEDDVNSLLTEISGTTLKAGNKDGLKPAGSSYDKPAVSFSQLDGTAEFGKYRDLQYLGQGGMARVYRAFDPDLGRSVAIKVLRTEDPDLKERLLREAKTQARIEHDRVCRVYEVGEVDGVAYIAMQFIEGKTLKEVHPELAIELKLRMMQEICEAVHEAHRAGLIHRDIKPANIMVERTEDAEWVPYILDFGLAREVGSSGLTETGAVIGTLRYMSPEQARGEVRKMDRRSDVYSLGVTLHELVSPEELKERTSDIDFMVRLVDEHSATVHRFDPELPSDLQTIIQKCLEKEPHRRYDSAKALGDDLGRYLAGEAILARKTHLLYRMKKKAQKHRVLMAVIIGALLFSSVMSALWLRTRKEASERTMVAQELGQEVERIEAILRQSYLSPLHDVRPEMKRVRERIRFMEDRVKNSGSFGRAAADYALGRAYLAVNELEKAQTLLQRAWNSGYQNADVAYALGRTLGKLYENKLSESASLPEEQAQREKRQSEINYRIPALGYLKIVQQGSGDNSLYLEGLIAFYDRDYDQALAAAKKAVENNPWLYEAWAVVGNAYSEKGNKARDAGDLESALTNYDLAEKAYTTAAEIGESDPESYLNIAYLHSNLTELHLYQTGKEIDLLFEKIEEAAKKALVADADNLDAQITLVDCYWSYGQYQSNKGIDPKQNLMKAIQAGETAMRLNPKDPDSYRALGTAYTAMGEYEMDSDSNAAKTFKRAIDTFQNGLKLGPSTNLLNNLALAYSDFGDFEFEHGGDPAPSYNLAIENLNKSIKIEPEGIAVYNLGFMYQYLAEYESIAGKNAPELYSKAIEAHNKALKLNPNDLWTFMYLGVLYSSYASDDLLHGRSPEEHLKLSRDYLRKAGSLSRTMTEYLDESCKLELVQAEWSIANRKSPEENLKAAEDYVREIQLMDDDPSYKKYLVLANLYRATWLADQKKQARSEIDSGLRWANSLISESGEKAEYLLATGRLHLLASKIAKTNTEKETQKNLAAKDFNRAKELNRNYTYLADHYNQSNQGGRTSLPRLHIDR